MILFRSMGSLFSTRLDATDCLLKERYELVDCLMDLRRNITIHGDDVLAHSNWEINAKFVEKYPCVFRFLRLLQTADPS